MKWSESPIIRSILQWYVRIKFSVSSAGQALDQAVDHASEVISVEGGDPTPNLMDLSGDYTVYTKRISI